MNRSTDAPVGTRMKSPWNSLAAALRRQEMTLHTLKWQLEAYLFHIWCVDKQNKHPPPPGAVVAFFVILTPDTKLPTYLLTYWEYRVNLLGLRVSQQAVTQVRIKCTRSCRFQTKKSLKFLGRKLNLFSQARPFSAPNLKTKLSRTATILVTPVKLCCHYLWCTRCLLWLLFHLSKYNIIDPLWSK